jgi:hypothetical protein
MFTVVGSVVSMARSDFPSKVLWIRASVADCETALWLWPAAHSAAAVALAIQWN